MTRNERHPVAPHLLALIACCSLAVPLTEACAQALDPQRPEVTAFIADVAQRNGFEPAVLVAMFAQVESRPAILQAIARPAEKALTWEEYRGKFLTDKRIQAGAQVYRDMGRSVDQAQATTGVPADIILGIVGVETFFGANTGKHRVIDALSTLAFDYAPRAAFFRGELEQYLLMAREEKLDPLAPLGSYAGAMGIPQFMPTSFRKWAVDGDGDGQRNLWNDWPDVFLSVGNYLKLHGWRTGEPIMVPASVDGANLEGLQFGKLVLDDTIASLRARGIKFETSLPADAPATLVGLSVPFGIEYRVGFTNFNALTSYNRSHMYASAVNDLAEALATVRKQDSALAAVRKQEPTQATIPSSTPVTSASAATDGRAAIEPMPSAPTNTAH